MTSFSIYFNRNRDLLIIGEIDSNYVCWVSLTKVDESKINEMIFNYIMNIKFDLVSNKYLALNKINLKYENLRKWYHTYIRKASDIRWSTPFDCYYNKEQEKIMVNFLLMI